MLLGLAIIVCMGILAWRMPIPFVGQEQMEKAHKNIGENRSEIQTNRASIVENRSKIVKNSGDIAAGKARIDSHEKSISKWNKELKALLQKYAALRKSLQDERKRSDTLEKELLGLKEELSTLQARNRIVEEDMKRLADLFEEGSTARNRQMELLIQRLERVEKFLEKGASGP